MMSEESAYRLSNLNDKPGLEKVDKEHVARVIYEASKGSQFFENEKRKEAKLQARVAEMMVLMQEYRKDPALETRLLASTQKLVDELEASRDLSHTWIHIDMDAFYVSVELLDAPHLRGKPVAVGDHAMLSTASYEARAFGVRSAMPGFIGKKLCPELVMIRPNFAKYRAISERIRAVFAEYDPHFIPTSLDEAYLNVTAYLRTHPELDGAALALEIRRRIHDSTQLTASAGIACNMLLAKICSDQRKPNGQFALPADRDAILAFMRALPTAKLHGVGKVTDRLLQTLGVRTCADVYQQRALLCHLLTPCLFHSLLRSSLGIGTSETPPDEPRKSVGHERTFAELSDRRELLAKCRELCEAVARDLAEEQLRCRAVGLKLKQSDFTLRTRSVSLVRPIQTADELYRYASEMLVAELPLRLRLMGVRAFSFVRPAVVEGPLTAFLRRCRSTPDRTAATAAGDDGRASSDSEAGGPGAAGTRTYECPVCLRHLRLDGPAMEAHLDACLDGHRRSRSPSPVIGAAVGAVGAVTPLPPPPPPPPASAPPAPGPSAAASSFPERECPVCLQRVRLSEVGMEAHVMACLQAHEQRIQQQQQQQQQQRKKLAQQDKPPVGKRSSGANSSSGGGGGRAGGTEAGPPAKRVQTGTLRMFFEPQPEP